MVQRSARLLLIASTAAALATASQALGAEPAFTNLHVLSKDIEVVQLLAQMQMFEAGLGKDCDYCHVVVGTVAPGGPGRLPTGFDFALDDKPTKRIARQMMVMSRTINAMTPAAVGKTAENTEPVQCFNCHRGMATPPVPLRDILDRTTAQKGLSVAIAQYRELRSKYYGSAAYDFSDTPIGEGAGSGTGGLQGYAAQLFFQGRIDDALAWLNVNLEFYPKSAATWATIAFVQGLVKHNKTEAIRSLQKAIAIEPQSTQLKAQLGVLEALP